MKVRKGGGEEIPLIQGKEQRLHFAGAAVKRYPMSKVQGKRNPSKMVGVARGHQRANTLPATPSLWKAPRASGRPSGFKFLQNGYLQ